MTWRPIGDAAEAVVLNTLHAQLDEAIAVR